MVRPKKQPLQELLLPKPTIDHDGLIAQQLADYIREMVPTDALNELVVNAEGEFPQYRNDPNGFAKDILGINPTDQQETIANSVLQNRFTTVEAGHSLGKSTTAAILALWWVSTRNPATLLSSAPCYDDQTEVLTSSGWKLFRDLNGSELVAQLNGDMMEFAKPEDYIQYPYNGEMIGYKSQLLDFLVTPNHHCVFGKLPSSHTHNKKKYRNVIQEAKDIYGKTGQFRRYAEWIGEDTSVTLEFAEFLGFWIAEGSARPYRDGKKNSETTITNKNIEYTTRVITNAGFKFSIQKRGQQDCYNFVIYDFDLSNELLGYGQSKTKHVPNKIKNATPKVIRAFLDGFREGDGTVDKGGSEKLYTSSKILADDLQELCLKAGFIANVSSVTREDHKIGKYNYTGYTSYVVSVWHKRGRFPQVQKTEWWYKENYDGMVYCIKVPTGIILIRRNGKYIWSGNSFHQVNGILWRNMRQYKERARAQLPGIIFQTPRWEIAPHRFGVGVSPRKATDVDVATMQGYHSPNLLVILDEAGGLTLPLWNVSMSLVTGEFNRFLAIGNPVARSGPFFDSTQQSSFHSIRISCLDHPNVLTGTEVIPGAVSRQWVEERINDWCHPTNNPNDRSFQWKGKWYDPLPVFEARVLGRPPVEAEDQLIPLHWATMAQRPIVEAHSGERVLGLDVARHGSASSAIIYRVGDHVLWVKRQRGNDTTVTSDWLMAEIKENEADVAYIDEIGIGGACVDQCTRAGAPVQGVNVQRQAMQKTRFSNMRHELWWTVREKLRTGEMTLPFDDDLIADLTCIKYSFDPLGRIQVEEKEQTIKRLGRSPDAGDALALSYMGNVPGSTRESLSYATISSNPSSWYAGASRWTVNSGRQRRSWKIR